MQSVRVNRKGAGRVSSGHPWIFRSDILDTGGAEGGALVKVIVGDTVVGAAHYSDASQIALRMLGQNIQTTDVEFYKTRFRNAGAFRELVVRDSTAYRLVSAEADFLPALIIDRYADWFVLQTLNQGMDRDLPAILAALQDLFQPAGIVARNDAPSRALERLARETRVLAGEPSDVVEIEMNGLRLIADLQKGMKTGVFLDQRENYLAASHWARGQVLDCFTSTGGFALHLARYCEHVEAIDSSEKAIEIARLNAQRNSIDNIAFHRADVFEALDAFRAGGKRFDMIVLDPPAFAKSRSHVAQARRAYRDLNRRALQLLNPNGVLISCSCSHHVSEADLLEVIAEASLECQVSLRVLERRMQGADHPILLTVPETLYLKCLIFQAAP